MGVWGDSWGTRVRVEVSERKAWKRVEGYHLPLFRYYFS
jgi:hypothetical protein